MYSKNTTPTSTCQFNTQAIVNNLGHFCEPSMTTVEISELTVKRHDNVLADTRKMLVELYGEKDALNFQDIYLDAYNREKPCYHLPKKEVLVLISGYSIKLRMKIVTRLEELENETRPENLSRLDILKIAMAAEKKRLAMEAENKEMQPKALFADAVSASSTSILVGEMAKILKQNGVKKMGQNRFFAWLRENGYLIRRKGIDFNMPTQKSMELGLFEIKERIIVNPDDSTRITKTSKVTGKGQQYFINIFLGQVGE